MSKDTRLADNDFRKNPACAPPDAMENNQALVQLAYAHCRRKERATGADRARLGAAQSPDRADPLLAPPNCTGGNFAENECRRGGDSTSRASAIPQNHRRRRAADPSPERGRCEQNDDPSRRRAGCGDTQSRRHLILMSSTSPWRTLSPILSPLMGFASISTNLTFRTAANRSVPSRRGGAWNGQYRVISLDQPGPAGYGEPHPR